MAAQTDGRRGSASEAVHRVQEASGSGELTGRGSTHGLAGRRPRDLSASSRTHDRDDWHGQQPETD